MNDMIGKQLVAAWDELKDAKGVFDRIDVIAEVADAAPLCMGEIRQLISAQQKDRET